MKIEHLEKSFGTVKVLKDINLSVKSGERIAILGGNGSGKTTLLNIINGGIKATGGSIDFEEMAINHQNTAYIMQHESLPSELRLQEVLALFSRDKAAYQRGLDLADQFDLTKNLRKKYAQLSGGEKQKLLLISSLQNQPSYFFLDEITTGLDYNSRDDLLDFLASVFEEKQASLFLVTHYIEEALRLCNRFVVIKSGKIIEDFTKEALISNEDSLIRFDQEMTAYQAYLIQSEQHTYKLPKALMSQVLAHDFEHILSYERDFTRNLGQIIEGA
ncbi:ABC transporter ATP-binding protein [Lactococcus termiticola]|uniref:ABC transporter ATP-binding protein n=1 Tax=Lactococcus termiticola TaxID=2169526 RepID=A0A2R5HGN8_9LACT|nr:ABC transporter ATP-binding protein [Lactococcus termiticola]GBG97026.1 ABC transporter ATP-binding protein [Lactococcus termiticola]